MNKKLSSFLIKGSMLACLLVAAPVAGNAASETYTLNDKDITLKVKDTVNSYKDIKIESDNGMVTVSGTVPTQAEKDKILANIRNVNGVKSGKDELRVGKDGSGSVGEYFDDAAITTVVKSKFLGQKGLDSLDISVETVQGTVTLTGQVDNPSQIGLAEDVAMKADGGKRVVNKLTFKPLPGN